ncbi:hypothetical protein CMU11_18200 [Elizabethkingia anophelis]|uniref:Uncharacterized protein n=1 Tax=Elizabethkingia anophelis TaxID=1117645 RepID=A0A1T3M0I7_9FLAO|nr:hypothetical protein [Elizabethkingia anophelis]AQW96816.1 hypothetical protein BBD31_02430 [Elizabethkingia anophelis]AQX52584.1 hypothetical protein AYC66_18695 [Elizabethkingia anophelis]AQX90750.1 hypothetical protein AYC67_17810 [Elizabethkingia anophelis]ASV80022.1 hypothetical protein A6J37_16155 [Elizabethkingia anophelis]EHM8032395.1 hypothetical protein [Elizabethkingia anophelis]
MKKIILNFWLVNLLISILLFFLYKIVMMETKQTDATFLGNILYIIDILLNLGFSLIYLAVMVLGSLPFFLNLIEKIRNNSFLSFLAFSGIPLICVIYLMANVSIDLYQYKESLLIRLISFSIMYLLCTCVEFLMFRKKIKSLKYSHSVKM